MLRSNAIRCFRMGRTRLHLCTLWVDSVSATVRLRVPQSYLHSLVCALSVWIGRQERDIPGL